MKFNLGSSRNNWPKIIIISIILAVVVTFGAVFTVHKIYTNNLRPLDTNQKTITVTIPKGSSLNGVAKILKDKKIIKSDWAFTQYVRNEQASDVIKAGTYDLSPSQSVQEIVSIITEGKIKTNLITILPGQRLDQIKKTFINSGFSADSVERAFNPALYKDHPALSDKPSNASLEGYLYPDSFQKISETQPEEIITKSLDEMQKALTPELRDAIVKHGLTVHQGVILASIIQQESDNQKDSSKIAQVFYSRLKKGMKLESDVTAFYGAIIAGKTPTVFYKSPYNTYYVAGLPAGPISNVTKESLDAVANPAKTDFLYFVAGDDGQVYFSSTLEEHQAQISNYCTKSCGAAPN